MVEYELKGALYVASEGKYTRVDLESHSGDLGQCLLSAVARITAMVLKAQEVKAWPSEVLHEQMAEVTLSLRQRFKEDDQGLFEAWKVSEGSVSERSHTEPCQTKACPHRLAMQHQDDGELLEIIEDNTLAEGGVS